VASSRPALIATARRPNGRRLIAPTVSEGELSAIDRRFGPRLPLYALVFVPTHADTHTFVPPAHVATARQLVRLSLEGRLGLGEDRVAPLSSAIARNTARGT
jgi:hypothetical protein